MVHSQGMKGAVIKPCAPLACCPTLTLGKPPAHGVKPRLFTHLVVTIPTPHAIALVAQTHHIFSVSLSIDYYPEAAA